MCIIEKITGYTIQRVVNGYEVVWLEEVEDGRFKERKEVFEDLSETDESEKECIIRLLSWIAENVCFVTNDNYAKDNLRISFDKKGRKVEYEE